MSVWEILGIGVAAVGGQAVLLGVVAFLLRSLITHQLDKSLEAHRTQLESDYELQLEKTRADLQRVATEHQIRFGKLYEHAADTIAETFALLQDLHSAYREMNPAMPEKLRLAEEAFARMFFRREILFPREVSQKIRRYYEKLHQIMTFVVANPVNAVDTLCARRDKVETEAGPILAEIFTDLQAMFHIPLVDANTAESSRH